MYINYFTLKTILHILKNKQEKYLSCHVIQRFRCTTFYLQQNYASASTERCRMCPKDRGAIATKRCTGCFMKLLVEKQ